MLKKKTAPKPKPKKAAPKPKAPAAFPPNPSRNYGATVFSVRTDDKEKAAEYVSKHGFRVTSKGASHYELVADALAYASYRGE